MVGIVPRRKPVGSLKHWLRLFVISVSRFRILGKNPDEFQQAAGGKTVNHYLPVESAGKKRVVLVVFAGRDIDFRRRVSDQYVVISTRRGGARVQSSDRHDSDRCADEERFSR